MSERKTQMNPRLNTSKRHRPNHIFQSEGRCPAPTRGNSNIGATGHPPAPALPSLHIQFLHGQLFPAVSLVLSFQSGEWLADSTLVICSMDVLLCLPVASVS